jgi:hypothetical protein
MNELATERAKHACDLCLIAGANPGGVAQQLRQASSEMLVEVYSQWIDGADNGPERGRVGCANYSVIQSGSTLVGDVARRSA